MAAKTKNAPAKKSAKKKAPPRKRVIETIGEDLTKTTTVDATAESSGSVEAKPKRKGKAATIGEAKPKKLSAIDAAAQVLAASKEPMNCKQMIEAMAAKGLWTSPGGKTPAATLYSAILREVNTKGAEARFKKTDRGQFAAKG